MIKKIEYNIINILISNDIIDENECEIYAYGLDLLFNTILSTMILFLTGTFWGKMVECVIIITLFYISQSVGGGFHAKTRRKCMACMFFGLCIAMCLIRANLNISILLITGFGSIIVLWSFPLILHKNKLYLIIEKERLINRSKTYTCFFLVLFILFYFKGEYRIINSFSVALLLCACSRLAAIISKNSMYILYL